MLPLIWFNHDKAFEKEVSGCLEQVFDFDCVFSRRVVEDKVIQFSETFGQQALAYAKRGKRVVIYTSKIFTDKLEAMKKGDTVADHNTGRVGVITSEKPFFCGCTLCFRVDFADSSDVYECAYFM